MLIECPLDIFIASISLEAVVLDALGVLHIRFNWVSVLLSLNFPEFLFKSRSKERSNSDAGRPMALKRTCQFQDYRLSLAKDV